MGQNNVENVSGGKWLTIRLVQRLSAESGTQKTIQLFVLIVSSTESQHSE